MSDQNDFDSSDSVLASDFNWRVPEWFKSIDLLRLKQLEEYNDELRKFNKVVNLVSPKTLPMADSTHFADSILASQIVYKNINKNKSLHDIGSGNGFPGMVFGILYPEIKVVLVDSDERKCEFLKHVVKQVDAKNISVLNVKTSQLKDGSIEQAVCRGFAPLPKALLFLRKLVVKDGCVFHLKSEDWPVELSQIPTQLFSSWKPELLDKYTLPETKIKLFIVRTEKIS